MATVHISEADAANDLPGLLARVRAGEDVMIHNGQARAVSMQAAPQPPVRKLSEILQSLEKNGSDVTLDDEFGRDVEEFREWARQPRPSPWD